MYRHHHQQTSAVWSGRKSAPIIVKLLAIHTSNEFAMTMHGNEWLHLFVLY